MKSVWAVAKKAASLNEGGGLRNAGQSWFLRGLLASTSVPLILGHLISRPTVLQRL